MRSVGSLEECSQQVEAVGSETLLYLPTSHFYPVKVQTSTLSLLRPQSWGPWAFLLDLWPTLSLLMTPTPTEPSTSILMRIPKRLTTLALTQFGEPHIILDAEVTIHQCRPCNEEVLCWDSLPLPQELPCVGGGLDGASWLEGTLRRLAGTGRHTPGAQPTFGRVHPWPRPRGGHQGGSKLQVSILLHDTLGDSATEQWEAM